MTIDKIFFIFSLWQMCCSLIITILVISICIMWIVFWSCGTISSTPLLTKNPIFFCKFFVYFYQKLHYTYHYQIFHQIYFFDLFLFYLIVFFNINIFINSFFFLKKLHKRFIQNGQVVKQIDYCNKKCHYNLGMLWIFFKKWFYKLLKP